MKKIGAGFLIVFLLLFISFSLGQGAEPKNVILLICDGMGRRPWASPFTTTFS